MLFTHIDNYNKKVIESKVAKTKDFYKIVMCIAFDLHVHF